MRLGFHYHVPAVSKPNGIYMPGHLGRFIDSLAAHCEQVICFLHSPLEHEIEFMDHRIVSANAQLIDMGPHTSILARTLQTRRYTSFIKSHAANMDVLLIRGPSPLLPVMANASPVPVALLLVGDYVAGVNDLPQPRWRKEIIRLWSAWNKWGQNRAAARSLTFVNSRLLYDELQSFVPHLQETRTTTLTKDDFFIRADTCQHKPYRLLYAGRMDRAKGLLQMVEAVSILTKQGEDVVLDLVGWKERGDPILEEMQTLAKEKNIADRVHYLGSRPLGPELFACYRQADFFITASLASEGFPRAIWEAMANSLPVIATKVGSIPDFANSAAQLVEPRNAGALADAVQRLIHDPSLRQHLIVFGRTLAMENTLENRSKEMADTLSDYLHSLHKEKI